MKKIFKWEYKPSGNCPVQANGWFLGYYFYFRSRHEKATIEFYNDRGDFELGELIFFFELIKTEKHRAGWLEKSTCKRLIYKGCFLFLIKLLKL